ncbi:hypothetical protein GCM10010284_19310 [Streptomyces rubiginosohelvolus]|uniref:Uncharacterized protein n=1 Tax=Streptomyces rubiginosohelvolus TaxID=67362 RepID=A0ABQ3BIT6_9ACTN|nr:hypothetical protein GCM10010284_19310 [Streptomyces rubiginosohelvolus]GGZ46532.1 hypothetical protein GCM10010328_21060 [Streptomyces pluricolorescens]
MDYRYQRGAARPGSRAPHHPNEDGWCVAAQPVGAGCVRGGPAGGTAVPGAAQPVGAGCWARLTS